LPPTSGEIEDRKSAMGECDTRLRPGITVVRTPMGEVLRHPRHLLDVNRLIEIDDPCEAAHTVKRIVAATA